MKVSYLFLLTFLICLSMSCTDLKDEVFSEVEKNNYYQTKEDIENAVYRPMEHGFWSIISRFESQEEPSDQLITPPRDSWYIDGSIWRRWHYHTWTIQDRAADGEWTVCFQGIAQVNIVLNDLKDIDPAEYNLSIADFNYYIGQLKTMRAWFYIRLLDAYRNIPLATEDNIGTNNLKQKDPKVVFKFIESELKTAMDYLPNKQGNNGNGKMEGQWMRAGAASLLVRLYLNADKWIDKDYYDSCAVYAQNIIDGKYGFYELGKTWDEAFDWKNDESNAVIFGFPSSFGGTHWHYDAGDMYWRTVPAKANPYLGIESLPYTNNKYAMAPSQDVDGNPYNYDLGGFVAKFKKYPEDYRLIKYRNLGNNEREGMFMYGYMEYKENGQTKRLKSATFPDEDLYIRDKVGKFHDAAPGESIDNKESNMITGGDHNSGWQFAKYPIYPDNEAGCRESDYAEIRLAEIYYSLAEVKLRKGEINEAGRLLNAVRKRNYPETTYDDYLYKPEGKVELTESELLDEWGREFLAEGRRRTDLCRWNKFSSGKWWDKQPDEDKHTAIYPISETTLSANPNLKQNPGY